MIDNKRLTPSQTEGLSTITYQTQVEIYEKHCANCPFRLVKIGTESDHADFGRRDFSKHTAYVDYSDRPYDEVILILQELFSSTDISVKFFRGCQYGGEELSLMEIIMNTCRFWKTETDEGGDDNPDQRFDAFKTVRKWEIKC